MIAHGTLCCVIAVTALALPASRGEAARSSVARQASPEPVAVIVRAEPFSAPVAAAQVRRLGGEVTRALPLLDGFAARVPMRALGTLTASPAVAAVWPDTRVRLHGGDDDEEDDPDDDDIPLAEYDALPPNEVWGRQLA